MLTQHQLNLLRYFNFVIINKSVCACVRARVHAHPATHIHTHARTHATVPGPPFSQCVAQTRCLVQQFPRAPKKSSIKRWRRKESWGYYGWGYYGCSPSGLLRCLRCQRWRRWQQVRSLDPFSTSMHAFVNTSRIPEHCEWPMPLHSNRNSVGRSASR